MINILHGIAAVAAAVLLELFTGGWGWVIPFTACILNRVTAKFPLPWVFLSALGTGLIFDLIYWRKFPAAALSVGLTVPAVRLAREALKVQNRFAAALVSGLFTGVLLVFLMALLQGYPDGRRLPVKLHLITSVAGALVFQTLISPLGSKSREIPERQPQSGEAPEKKSAPRKKNKTASQGKTSGRKK